MKQNWKNRTMWTGDNLPIMRGMNSECVDLIYLDPPFNSNRTYSAPIGSEAAGAAFKDTWTLDDVDDAWHGEIAEQNPAVYAVVGAAGEAHGKGMKSYLIMMAVRLLEMRRLLKPTGSLYLHCDPTASHYLKLLMDSIFGKGNFRNEIVWHYGQRTAFLIRNLSRKHDTILFCAKSNRTLVNKVLVPWGKDEFLSHRHDVKKDENGNLFIWTDGGSPGKRYKRMVSNVLKAGKPLDDVWNISLLNSSAKERVGYPTQKPLKLLSRIIKASSNEGDMVLDPFAGCATACVAAERLDRQWVGIDISEQAAHLVQIRIRKEIDLFHNFKPIHRSDIPKRTDLGKLPDYRTHKHLLFGKQEGRCAGCQVAFPFRNFTIDHVVPQSKGGTDHMDNLQLLCGACNSMKGTGTQAELIVKLQAQELR